MKDRTGASQWDFPTEEDKEEDLKGGQVTQTQTASQGDTKTSSASAPGVTGQSLLIHSLRRMCLLIVVCNDFQIENFIF